MKTQAVVFDRPQHLSLRMLDLPELGEGEVSVAVEYSGISTGTERMLWDGTMPTFPGMGYPLVPGYEAVGRVTQIGQGVDLKVGQRLFVPGTNRWQGVHSLFGGAAAQLVTSDKRVVCVDDAWGQEAVLLALAATAYHAVSGGGLQAAFAPPELIIGHGVMGRLLARLTVASGAPAPVVWETQTARCTGAQGYSVMHPNDDPRRDYGTVYDVSGDATQLNAWISRMRAGGELVLAGFYKQDIQFAFAPAFMREVRLRVAAQWRHPDLQAVTQLVHDGRLSLDGLVTHTQVPAHAHQAYTDAFGDVDCLKMVLNWSGHA